MFLDCGCHKPMEKHGDERHITMQDLQQAAQASKISVYEAARRIQQEVQEGGSREMASSTQS